MKKWSQIRWAPDLLRTVIYSKTTLISQGLNLVTISVIIWFLGNKNYGLYQYGLGLVGTALLFGHLGTDGISFREFSMPLRQACSALPRVMLVRIAGILASLAVLAALIGLGRIRLPFDLFLAVSATGIAESFMRIGMGWHRGRHLAWTDFWTTTGRSFTVLVLVLIVVPRHPDALGIAIAYGTGTSLILLSLIWQWRRILLVGWKNDFHWPRILKSAPNFFYLDIAGNFIGMIPVLFLGHYQHFAELGLYAIYSKYLTPFSVIATLYTQSLQPSIVKAFHRGTPVQPLLQRGAIIVAAVGGAGVLACGTIGTTMLVYLAHQQPLDIALVAILSTLTFLIASSAFVDSILTASRNEHLLIYSHSLSLLVCAVSSFALSQSGARGAAAAVSLAMLAKVASSVWIVTKIAFRKPITSPERQ